MQVRSDAEGASAARDGEGNQGGEQVVSVHRLKIARRVVKYSTYTSANFELESGWWCCEAWKGRDWPKGQGQVWTRNTAMTIEQASTVSIALKMAIEWLAEQQ